MIKEIFNFGSFVDNNFEENEKVVCDKWNNKALRLGSIYSILESAVLFFVTLILLSIVIVVIIDRSYIGYAILLSLLIGGYWISNKWNQVTDVIQIPNGFHGLPVIRNRVRGEEKKITLREGDYRTLPTTITLTGDPFKVERFPLTFPNKDVQISNIKSKDAILLIADVTILKWIVNPWVYIRDIRGAVGSSEITEISHFNIPVDAKLEDLATQGLNNSADNENLVVIMNNASSDDGSEKFTNMFQKELKELDQTREKEKRYLTNSFSNLTRELYHPDTGLNFQVNIKAYYALDPEVTATFTEKIRADAEALKIRTTGKAKAEAEAMIAEESGRVFLEHYDELHKKRKMEPELAAQKATLIANLYATEVLTEIGNSNGTPIAGGFSLEKIIAGISVFAEKYLKGNKSK